MREYIECDFCDKEFVKGTGHLCWCDKCSKKHPMCDPCYKEALKDNTIRETPQNKMVYNKSTLDDGK